MKKTIATAILAAALLTACSDSKTHVPVLTLVEVGEDNSREATVGDDLHLEAIIEAEELTRSIDVELTTADGDTLALHYADGKYIGVRNTTFHEHLDLPSTTAPGTATLRMSATDREGQIAEASATLTLKPAEQ